MYSDVRVGLGVACCMSAVYSCDVAAMCPPFCDVPETPVRAFRQSVSVNVESSWEMLVTLAIEPTSPLER